MISQSASIVTPRQTFSVEHHLGLSGKYSFMLHAAINARIQFVHKRPSLYIARYSFIQLGEVEKCRVKTTSPTLNMAAHKLP